jgi:hypothetical protein
MPTVGVNAERIQSGMGPEDCKGVMTIHVGDIITWTNNTEEPRQVVSVDKTDHANGLIESEIIMPGNSFSFKFNEEAEYEYYCMTPHKSHGFVKVINEGIDNDERSISADSIKEQKIPKWFINVLIWYDQKQITQDEFLNALEFLADKKILSLE